MKNKIYIFVFSQRGEKTEKKKKIYNMFSISHFKLKKNKENFFGLFLFIFLFVGHQTRFRCFQESEEFKKKSDNFLQPNRH